MLRIRTAPVHFRGRPCATWQAAGGGPATLRPSCVTCAECAPAAAWIGLQVERLQVAGGALVLGGFLFLLGAVL